MNERETERRFRDWLDAQAPIVAPDGLRRAVAAIPVTVPVRWPDRLAAALGPRRAAVPRLAWVLLLLAGLLAALVGGMLVVGSQVQRKLPAVVPPVVRPVVPPVGPVPTCPPGSNPDEPGPVDQARPFGLLGKAELERMAFDRRERMAFDRRAGRLVALAGGLDGPVKTWTFDVCTNTWTRMHPNREPPPGTGQLVYDVDSDVTIAFDGTRMWVYDLQANTWTEQGPYAPFAHSSQESLRFYDPVSGHVVALGDDGDDDTLGLEMWSYEVETDTWTPIRQAKPLAIGPHFEFFAYDASVDRLVAYSKAWEPADPDWDFEARTWLFDLRTGTWSGTGAVTPPDFDAGMWGYVPAIAYDEAAERTVLLGQGHSAAYDATADRWETLYAEDPLAGCGSRPECRQMPFMVYDAVNERLVVYGGSFWTGSDWVSPDDWLAFDTRTREWAVLLEASQPVTPGVLPSPGS